jgi:hypothetical protein
VRGLHKRTKSPTSSSRSLTFGSLHTLVSSWYLCRLAIALSLSSSNKSLSSTSLGHVGTFADVSNTASTSYISQNGVKFGALETVVLWLHTALGMTFNYLPFFSHSSIFLIVSNIMALTLSTTPLDWG